MSDVETFKPFMDQMVVLKDKEQEKSLGGILIPEVSRDYVMTGVVMDIGKGYWSDDGYFIATTLKPGDRVCFPPWAGYEVELQGQQYQVMRENDALAEAIDGVQVSLGQVQIR